MITEATLNGALDEQIMPHSRHKDASSMRRYRRRARILVDNPARLLDLWARRSRQQRWAPPPEPLT
jgi:hypothetical protein